LNSQTFDTDYKVGSKEREKKNANSTVFKSYGPPSLNSSTIDERCLIRGVAIDERCLIRGVAIDERCLIRGVAIDERCLIRGVMKAS
jgi:ADP-glucose pyrophosphorylase